MNQKLQEIHSACIGPSVVNMPSIQLAEEIDSYMFDLLEKLKNIPEENLKTIMMEYRREKAARLEHAGKRTHTHTCLKRGSYKHSWLGSHLIGHISIQLEIVAHLVLCAITPFTPLKRNRYIHWATAGLILL